MSKKSLMTVPKTDPGSEAGIGFDFQWHVVSRLCIAMLLDQNMVRIVNECGEDATIVRKGQGIELVQIKKRDSGAWNTEALVKPAKKQKMGVLGKLFTPLQEGKDVHRLCIKGCGRVSGGDIECSLPNLIALLKTPANERDEEWEALLVPYVSYLRVELAPQGISPDTIAVALRILDIDFSLPHPDSIESRNKESLATIVKQIWEVDLTNAQAQHVYTQIYLRVKEAAANPNRSWMDKSISREQICELVKEEIQYPYATADQRHSLTLQDKLSSAELGDKHKYALEARTIAIGLRFELDMTADIWENFKTEVHIAWQNYREENPAIKGLLLWQALRSELSRLGMTWASRYHDERLGPGFAEGIFFDMAGICSADFRRGQNNG